MNFFKACDQKSNLCNRRIKKTPKNHNYGKNLASNEIIQHAGRWKCKLERQLESIAKCVPWELVIVSPALAPRQPFDKNMWPTFSTRNRKEALVKRSLGFLSVCIFMRTLMYAWSSLLPLSFTKLIFNGRASIKNKANWKVKRHLWQQTKGWQEIKK